MKRRFFFVNTRLDHVGVQARRGGVALLCRKAAEIGQGTCSYYEIMPPKGPDGGFLWTGRGSILKGS